MATKQKTVEDYRNAVKLLKLKVIKLQRTNEELQEKLREQGITVATEDSSKAAPMNNQGVMGSYARQCKRIGLTPEMMFRAADFEGTGSIKAEDFRLFLSKVRLGLSQPQLTLIVRLLDEDCSGVIKREEYYDCLQAYGINEEKQGNSLRTFGQTCLLKYAKMLLQAQITAEDSFSKMDQPGKGIVTPAQFSSFAHAVDQNQQFNEKEIVAVFNHIDLDRAGTINRQFYETEVRKGMKAAASEMGIQNSALFAQTGQNFNISPSRLQVPNQQQMQQQPFQQAGGRAMESVAINLIGGGSMTQTSQLSKSQQMAAGEKHIRGLVVDRKKVDAVINKMKAYGLDPIQFIRNIVTQLQCPQAGVILYDVYKQFDQSGKTVPKSEQLKVAFHHFTINFSISFFEKFFEILDIEENGSVDYDELMTFYLEFRGPKDPFDGLFEILTRKLQAQHMDIAQYLSIEQIYEDTQLDIESFFPVSENLFMVQERAVSDELFKSMDADGSGILSANEIIHAVRAIMDIYEPPKILVVDPKMNASSKMRVSDKLVCEYEQILRDMKPVLTEDDFFSRYKLQGTGKATRIRETKWKTIFNSDVACLRYCYEVIAELMKNPGSKWSDPEFGSTPDDKFGSKSMYFADNDVPKGCPDPKEVKWLRPEEIIATMIENGNEELKHEEIDMFDAEGAASNDVKQSKYLGNCWFVSALSIIAGYDKYLKGSFTISKDEMKDLDDSDIAGMQKGVYPPCFQFLRAYGIYVMRFFKNFGWRYVMIDDRLCTKEGDFVYGRCRKPTELWVNLIEKAYAKLHNCYYAMTSGDIAQGLSDMTGLVADKTRIVPAELQTVEQKDKLWNMLCDSKKNGTMMGCSAEGETELYIQRNGEDTGVMSGHAYGIIDVFELPDANCKNYHKSHRLLKIRNPWGYGEWKLKWSENEEQEPEKDKLKKFLPQIDAYYDEEIAKAKAEKKQLPEKYISGVDDGTFLMCYKDWRTTYCNLFECVQSNYFIYYFVVKKKKFP